MLSTKTRFIERGEAEDVRKPLLPLLDGSYEYVKVNLYIKFDGVLTHLKKEMNSIKFAKNSVILKL